VLDTAQMGHWMNLARPAFAMRAGDDPATEETGMDPNDDLALVALAQANIVNFAPLYERYAPDIHLYCLRRLRNPEDAADATTMVFTRAISALPRFRPNPSRPGSTFRAWLFTIARNIVLDQYRRQRPTDSLDQPGHDMELADGQLSPEDFAIHADEARSVTSLLSRLSDRQRAVVELRLAGLRTAEIADSLGMTESAAKSLQVRAYRILRDLVSAADSPFAPEHDR
jgi:RNA polymerase sigma-70 factor (ECF subfamily)